MKRTHAPRTRRGILSTSAHGCETFQRWHAFITGSNIRSMHGDIQRVLISQYQIMGRIKEMAEQITADFPAGDITIVPILTGAMIFCGDLIRQIPIQMRIGLLTVSSYPGASLTSQGSQVLNQQLGEIKGRHVLLVDDILD